MAYQREWLCCRTHNCAKCDCAVPYSGITAAINNYKVSRSCDINHTIIIKNVCISSNMVWNTQGCRRFDAAHYCTSASERVRTLRMRGFVLVFVVSGHTQNMKVPTHTQRASNRFPVVALGLGIVRSHRRTSVSGRDCNAGSVDTEYWYSPQILSVFIWNFLVFKIKRHLWYCLLLRPGWKEPGNVFNALVFNRSSLVCL